MKSIYRAEPHPAASCPRGEANAQTSTTTSMEAEIDHVCGTGRDGRMQEAYDSKKFQASGADSHAIQCCLPSVTSQTSRRALQRNTLCSVGYGVNAQ